MADNKEDVKARILKNGVIVAGHPRSGTSLTCQLLESARVNFPSDFSGDEYNKGGYYELAQSKELSKNLIEKAMTIENTKEMNKIVKMLNEESGVSGLKLVRMPAIFFYKYVAKRLKAVFIFRNPADVKASLFRRGISRFEPKWVENNNALIAAYENIEDSIIISYESLINGDESVRRKFQSLGFDVDMNIIKKEHRTQKRSKVMVSNEEEKMYKILKELEREQVQ
ncbi:MAG: sulfotransferase domain-containing protein [Candidatus Woesearchaeota archaeon]